jgi:MsuE subfamily FMN reductase
MKLLGLCGSPKVKSKTLIAVEKAVGFAKLAHPELDTQVINIRDFDVQFCDGRDPSRYEGDTREIIEAVIAADALIVGTPMYRGSYTGILKNIFDVLPNDALQGKAVGIIATGGTTHHFLAIEHEIKPIIGFFYGHPLPGAVYATNDDYSDEDLVDGAVLDNLRELADDVIEFGTQIPRGVVGAARPSIPRRALAEQ